MNHKQMGQRHHDQDFLSLDKAIDVKQKTFSSESPNNDPSNMGPSNYN